MRQLSPWKVLGLPQDADRAAIRKAYAARLKAAHPEDDPEGFQKLRQAYERALAWSAQAHETPIDPPPATARRAPKAPNTPATSEAHLRRECETDLKAQSKCEAQQALESDRSQIDERHRAACQALESCVSDPTARPEQVSAALRALFASPALESLSAWESEQRWLARLIEQNCPRSDPMVDLCVERFGWSMINPRNLHDRIETFAQGVLIRQEDLQLARTWARQGSSQDEPWRWLTTSLTKRERWCNRVIPKRARRVRELLALIRSRYPRLEINLNKDAVAWWDRYFSKPQITAGMIWTTIGISQIVALTFLGEEGFDPPSSLQFVGGFVQAILAEAAFLWIYVYGWMRWRVRRKQRGR